MKELMMNEDFSDVTLVTEDKKQINANIAILSACSPFLKDILKIGKNLGLIIYLTGIQYSEMEPIMQCIYFGEAKLIVDQMDELFAIAKSLGIKELCNAEPERNSKKVNQSLPNNSASSTEMIKKESVTYENIEEQPKPKGKTLVASDNRKYECEKCFKTYSGKSGLYSHIQSVHVGLKYPCDQCDYRASKLSHLTRHIQTIHEGIKSNIKYACDLCNYQTNRQYCLNVHIQSIHENVKFDCVQCDYQATSRSSLTDHIKSKHKGVKYNCNQCNHQASKRANLMRHFKFVHKE